MRVHPAISALQRHPALQRRSRAVAQTALGRWLSCDEIAKIRRELAHYDRGIELNELAGLRGVLTDHTLASNFVSEFCAIFIDALRQEPLCEVPLTHGSSAGFARLQLLQSGGTSLMLCAYEPLPHSQAPEVAQFVDSEVVELVIAGCVDGAFHTLNGHNAGAALVSSHNVQWPAGAQIARRARCETRHFVSVRQTALVLQLSRTPSSPKPTVEYRLSDGALFHQTSGDKRASEQVMALAVLGAMEHHAGLGAMIDFAHERAGDPDARWEAVRQVLAMDTACGLSLLKHLSGCADDPLQVPAVALRHRVITANPQLRRYERQAS